MLLHRCKVLLGLLGAGGAQTCQQRLQARAAQQVSDRRAWGDMNGTLLVAAAGVVPLAQSQVPVSGTVQKQG